jgi:hypothetical protein
MRSARDIRSSSMDAGVCAIRICVHRYNARVSKTTKNSLWAEQGDSGHRPKQLPSNNLRLNTLVTAPVRALVMPPVRGAPETAGLRG